MWDVKRVLGRLPRLSAVGLVAVGFAAGLALGQRGVPVTAQEATPEAAPEWLIPLEDQERLYPIWQAYDLIRRGYRDPDNEGISANSLVDGALAGMAQALEDPNSYYINPAEVEAFDRRVSAQTVGLGIAVNTDEATGAVYVTRVVEESPAADAGILAGDIIVAIDGEDVSGLTQDDVVARSRGPEGAQVTLTMARGSARLDFTLTRSVIDRPVVSSAMIGEIGYLRLTQFASRSRQEMDAALATFTAAGARGLIIDLRNNAGGTSGAAVEVASAFIPEGVIFTEDFGRRDRVFTVNGNLADLDLPLVVLVNGRTQSAAEAFSGAIQDYQLGTIIGVPTFGKGTVQTVETLANGGALRFTIARVLTPSGDSYQTVGIQPDYVVEDLDGPADEQLDAALAFLSGQLAAPAATPEATTDGP
jgi:carboxyl-terminal processing protease